MAVSNVSFSGLAQTKNGNIYEKKNTYKRLGTAVGLVGSAAAVAFVPQITGSVIATSVKAMTKGLPIGPKAIIGAGILATTLLFRAIGSIPDHFINNKRKAKADKLAQNA